MLTTFIADLIRDDKLQREFSRDPEGVMSRAGLNAEQQAALLAEDRMFVGNLVARELAAHEGIAGFWPAPQLQLSSISPNQGGQATTLPVTLFGAWFSEGSSARLEHGAQSIPILVDKVSGSGTQHATLTGTLTIGAEVPTGMYTVRVKSPDATESTLPLGFEVLGKKLSKPGERQAAGEPASETAMRLPSA